MRLSDWRATASNPESLNRKIESTVVAVLTGLGAEPDPECWVLWGDDPMVRWFLMAPTSAGLLQVNVRVNVAQEGPRAAGRLVRWSRVQVGDFQVEAYAGHRVLSFQIESHVLHAVDAECEAMSAFIRGMLALIDGRSPDA
jgi:hypothetical protein